MIYYEYNKIFFHPLSNNEQNPFIKWSRKVKNIFSINANDTIENIFNNIISKLYPDIIFDIKPDINKIDKKIFKPKSLMSSDQYLDDLKKIYSPEDKILQI